MPIGDVIALSRWARGEHLEIEQEMIALRARLLLLSETMDFVDARLTRYELTDGFREAR